MSKEFKIGNYIIFNGAGKKIGVAKIHNLIEIDGAPYAVFTYYYDAIKQVRTSPVKIEGKSETIRFGNAGHYLDADAPVLPKAIKFQVGKTYIDDRHNLLEVTNKYTCNAITYIVLNNNIVTDIIEADPDGDNVEYAEFFNWRMEKMCKVYATNVFC